LKALLKIRVFIPLLVALLTIGVSVVDYWMISEGLNAQHSETMLANLKSNAIQTQGNINRALQRRDHVGAKQSLLDLNYQSLMSDAYLVDHDLLIHQSTNLSHTKGVLDKVQPIAEADIAYVRNSNIGKVFQDEIQQRAYAIFPIYLPLEKGEVRPRRWLLVIIFNYQHDLAALKSNIRKSSLQSGLIILGAIWFLSFIFHFLVTRRISKIASATNRYLDGDTSARTQMAGQDELGLIGSTFDRIAEAVERSQRELNHVNQELKKNNHELKLRELALDEHAIVSISDDAHRITYANAKFCQISGYDQSELLGNSHSMLNSGEHSQDFFKDLWNTITSGKVWHGDLKNRAKDGSYYWVAASIVPLLDPETQTYRYIRIQTDLTRQKDLNNELQETHSKNKRMYGIIAHELRTPVAAITMMTQHDDQQWLRDRGLIGRAANDLLHSIDDMKMLVNPELKREVRFESTSVDEINQSIQAMVASAVATTRMQYKQLTTLPDGISEHFITDVYRVKAAVTNLVRNGCLHSEGTQVVCHTSVEIDAQQRSWLCWSVSDDGKGIPEHKVPNLFQAFERGDSAAEGTGLGLHIAKAWIEEIGGTLTYKRLESGSKFLVRIPFGDSRPRVAARTQDDEKDLNDRAKACARQLRLLFVEDDPLIQKVTMHILKPLFAEIAVANDGREGLEKASGDYDVILTDYFMPNMTGVEMAEKLRQQGDLRPIIAATAATIGKEAEELKQAGVDIVLPKPLNPAVIIKSVAEFIATDRLPPLHEA
jgi:PAS domain S-box-containing protein